MARRKIRKKDQKQPVLDAACHSENMICSFINKLFCLLYLIFNIFKNITPILCLSR